MEPGCINGHRDNPNSEGGNAGTTGHAEALRDVYAGAQTSYRKLVQHIWRQVDSGNRNGQISDVGSQYRSGI